MGDDGEGRPECGPSARKLGVRLDGDTAITDERMVEPETGGMSVALHKPENLPRHRRPQVLGGRGIDPVWQLKDKDLPSALTLRVDPNNPSRHGFVEPIEAMNLDEYQEVLASSRGSWSSVVELEPQ